MDLQLEGQHVLITGGSKGIGLACALGFLREGARVSLVSRNLTTNAVTPRFFAARTLDAFSPRLSLIFRPTEQLSLRASAYRAFRAPTLNELYRASALATHKHWPMRNWSPNV